jgi:hypothetical protein
MFKFKVDPNDGTLLIERESFIERVHLEQEISLPIAFQYLVCMAERKEGQPTPRGCIDTTIPTLSRTFKKPKSTVFRWLNRLHYENLINFKRSKDSPGDVLVYIVDFNDYCPLEDEDVT